MIWRLRFLPEQLPLPINARIIELPDFFDRTIHVRRVGCTVPGLSRSFRNYKRAVDGGTYREGRPGLEFLQLFSDRFGSIVVGENPISQTLDIADV